MPIMLEKWKERHRSQLREWQLSLHLLRKSYISLLGLVFVVGVCLVAVFAPWIAINRLDGLGNAIHPEAKLQPPSLQHPFGTDDMGRDLFSRVIFGFQLSLQVGIIVVLIAACVGTALGLLSGYFGGKIDTLIMRTTDVFLSFPSLLLAILIVVTLGPGLVNVMFSLALTRWARYARLIRGQVLSIKEEPFVEAARMVGARETRIIFRHIFPSCISPLTVQSTVDMGRTILLAAALGFLGLGASSPTPELGLLVSIGRLYLPYWWWYSVFPGFAITVAVLGFNWLGDGMRDVLDPKLRRRL